jgi:hypothetical protein
MLPVFPHTRSSQLDKFLNITERVAKIREQKGITAGTPSSGPAPTPDDAIPSQVQTRQRWENGLVMRLKTESLLWLLSQVHSVDLRFLSADAAQTVGHRVPQLRRA